MSCIGMRGLKKNCGFLIKTYEKNKFKGSFEEHSIIGFLDSQISLKKIKKAFQDLHKKSIKLSIPLPETL